MPETRRTDLGAYVLVEIGEPTLANPTEWYSVDNEWKAGTPQANRIQLLSRAAVALQNNTNYLTNPAATLAGALTQVNALTRQVNALIRLTIDNLDTTGGT